MWKYVAVLVLLLGFTAPVLAGDVDGRALTCKPITYPDGFHRFFVFEGTYIYEAYVTRQIPLVISRTAAHPSKATVDVISWELKTNEYGHEATYVHVLDRKTLSMVRSWYSAVSPQGDYQDWQ